MENCQEKCVYPISIEVTLWPLKPKESYVLASLAMKLALQTCRLFADYTCEIFGSVSKQGNISQRSNLERMVLPTLTADC